MTADERRRHGLPVEPVPEPWCVLYDELWSRLRKPGAGRMSEGRPGGAEWRAVGDRLLAAARSFYARGDRGEILVYQLARFLHRDLNAAIGDVSAISRVPDDERLETVLLPTVRAFLEAARGKARAGQLSGATEASRTATVTA